MKKIFGILLAAVLILAGGLVSVYAEDNAGEPINEININNICTFVWAGESPWPSVVIDPEVLEKINVEEK